MRTPNFTILPLSTAEPLFAALDPGDAITHWRRVGLVLRTAGSVSFAPDPGMEWLLPSWRAASALAARAERGQRFVSFGVLRGRAGVVVIARTAAR
jgi:hypothetical protein